MRAALAQASVTLCRAKHRKGAIFRRKMGGFEVFLGLRGAERPVDVRLAPTVAVAKTAKRGAIRVSCPFVGQLIISSYVTEHICPVLSAQGLYITGSSSCPPTGSMLK